MMKKLLINMKNQICNNMFNSLVVMVGSMKRGSKMCRLLLHKDFVFSQMDARNCSLLIDIFSKPLH